jgi:pyruvate kinase
MAVDGANGEEVTGYIDPEDAYLIAAAPDMYAELEAAMNVFRFYQGHHAAKGHSDKEQTNKQYADRIQDVLAKARGGS